MTFNDKPLSNREGLHFSEKEIEQLASCKICPRKCGINRWEKEGLCGEDYRVRVASINLHHGEEPPISGAEGSGTIFFTGCNMSCIFCQNYPISQLHKGRYIGMQEFADAMLRLQKRGANNINFVTPSHFTIHIKRAVIMARAAGLTIPIVYNTSGYDSLETIENLKDIVDIYLADIRYQNAKFGKLYSSVPNYPEINRLALKAMFKQTGLLQTDENGIGTKGLILRHLVLPENLAETEKAFKFVVDELSSEIHISLMNQYFPAFKALETKPLDRKITQQEYLDATEILEKFSLHNGWVQEF